MAGAFEQECFGRMWQDVAMTDAVSGGAPAVSARAARNRAGASFERLSPSNVLTFDADEIAQVAAQLGPTGWLPALWARRLAREWWLRRLRHIAFRDNRNEEACEAYRKMRVGDFTGINVLQAWANWRTIPRNLSGVLPSRPLAVIDLCCAIGQSTAVLAYYCPPGSRILGLESSQEFVSIARRTAFTTCDGVRASVSFNAQDVLTTFRDAAGQPVESGSVDLVNCVGAIGCHFTPQDTRKLVSEIHRVLVAGGLAILDSGREGTDANTLREIASSAGFRFIQKARSCFADPRWQLCFRKLAD